MDTGGLAEDGQRPLLGEGDSKDLADTVRSMLEHESEAIHQRMGWLGAFEGLLFAATGIMWDKKERAPVFVLCGLGIIFSGLIMGALLTGSIATDRLVYWWEGHKPANYSGPGVIGYMPGPRKRWLRFFAPWFNFPIVFAAAWIALLLVNLTRTNVSVVQALPAVSAPVCTCPQQAPIVAELPSGHRRSPKSSHKQ